MSHHPTTPFTPTIDTSDGRHTVYDVPVLVNPQEPEKPLVDVLNAMERHISCARFQLFVLQVERAWPEAVYSLTLRRERESGEDILDACITHKDPSIQHSQESTDFGGAIYSNAFTGDQGFLGLVNVLFCEGQSPVQKTELPGILNRSLDPAVLAKIFADHLDDKLPATSSSPKPRF